MLVMLNCISTLNKHFNKTVQYTALNYYSNISKIFYFYYEAQLQERCKNKKLHYHSWLGFK